MDDFDLKVLIGSIFDCEAAKGEDFAHRLREVLNNLAAILDKDNDQQAAHALRNIAGWVRGQ